MVIRFNRSISNIDLEFNESGDYEIFVWCFKEINNPHFHADLILIEWK